MSHTTKGSGIGQILKALIITSFKFVAIVIAFAFKITGLILTKMSELLEKISDHGHR